MLQLFGILLVFFWIWVLYKITFKKSSSTENYSNASNKVLDVINSKKTNVEKFEWMLNDSMKGCTRQQILQLKSEGIGIDNPLFSIFLEGNTFSLKELAHKNLSPIGFKLGLNQNEINQSIEKVFKIHMSDLFVNQNSNY